MFRAPKPNLGTQGQISFRRHGILLAFVLLTLPGCRSRSEPLYQENPRPAAQKMAAEQMKLRQYLEGTVVPEFHLSGTLEEAINHLMGESKKWTPDGRPIGGFIVRGGLDQRRITIALENTNALALIDALASRAGGQWTLTPYAIEIHEPSIPANP